MKQTVQFTELIGNKNISRILEFFIDNPSAEYSQIEIIRHLSIAKATAVRWMRHLTESGLIQFKKIGVTNLYSLNNTDPFIKQLKILYIMLLLRRLSKMDIKDVEIYLYGSCARGEFDETSDIDILVIGNITRQKITEKIDKLSEDIGKDINFRIFRQIEWSKMADKDPAFFNRLEKDKIRLL